MPSVFIFSVTRKKRRNLSKRKDVEAHLTAAVGRTPLQRMIPGPGIDTERSKFHISDSILLPPANEVCEGYVFTGVCLSTGWGEGGVCPIACWDTPPGTRRRHPPGPEADTPWADTPLGQPPPGQTPPPQDQRQTPPGRTPPCPGPETDTLQRQTPPLGKHPQADPLRSAWWDTVNKRAVRIPLECILVVEGVCIVLVTKLFTKLIWHSIQCFQHYSQRKGDRRIHDRRSDKRDDRERSALSSRGRSRDRSSERSRHNRRPRSSDRHRRSRERSGRYRQSPKRSRRSPERSRRSSTPDRQNRHHRSRSRSPADRYRRRSRSPEKSRKRSNSRPRDKDNKHQSDQPLEKQESRGDKQTEIDKKQTVKEIGHRSESNTDPASVKFAKRNVGDAVNDARARYLARKLSRAPVTAPVEDDD